MDALIKVQRPYVPEKECRKCFQVKKAEFFPKRNKNYRDGLFSYCYECAGKITRIVTNNNKERYAVLRKERYENKKKDPIVWAEFRKKQADAYRKKRHTDPVCKTLHNLRRRLSHALERAGVRKTERFNDLIGCTPRQAVFHITNGGHDIPKGMDVDHHVPCSFFDLNNTDHQRICFNWRNLRVLTAKENLDKHNSLPGDYRDVLREICAATNIAISTFNLT